MGVSLVSNIMTGMQKVKCCLSLRLEYISNASSVLQDRKHLTADMTDSLRSEWGYDDQNGAWFHITPVVPDLKVLYQPKLEYPDDSQLKGEWGDVWVSAWVDSSGMVRKVEILKSSNHLFDPYALDYARQFRFAHDPRVKGGVMRAAIPVRFRN